MNPDEIMSLVGVGSQVPQGSVPAQSGGGVKPSTTGETTRSQQVTHAAATAAAWVTFALLALLFGSLA